MMLGLKGQHTQDGAIYMEGNFNGFPQLFVELAPSLRLYDARCPVKIRWIRAGAQQEAGSTTHPEFHG